MVNIFPQGDNHILHTKLAATLGTTNKNIFTT